MTNHEDMDTSAVNVYVKHSPEQLLARIAALEANQRPQWSRQCGTCGHEQIKVDGEWCCRVCEQTQEINDLKTEFGKEMADIRMRLAEDSRSCIAELEAALRKITSQKPTWNAPGSECKYCGQLQIRGKIDGHDEDCVWWIAYVALYGKDDSCDRPAG